MQNNIVPNSSEWVVAYNDPCILYFTNGALEITGVQFGKTADYTPSLNENRVNS